MSDIDEGAGAAREDGVDDVVARPVLLTDFIGQEDLKANLSVYLSAARTLTSAMDHVLLHGPPGLGKTTLAGVVANELGVGMRTISAPAVAKPSDLISALMGIEERDVLFIDEIHRLPAHVEEVLYSVMEDFRLDVIVGDGGAAKPVSISLPRFTLVGATTRPGSLTTPLRDRFGIGLRLEPYGDEAMNRVVARAAERLSLPLHADASMEIARRSRGTPRVGLRLLRRVRDFAISCGRGMVTASMADEFLTRIGIDGDGLNDADCRYLDCLQDRFGGGPVGLSTLSAALGDTPETIEHSIEPYLVGQGFVDRTPRGRVLRRLRRDRAPPDAAVSGSDRTSIVPGYVIASPSSAFRSSKAASNRGAAALL